MHVRRAVLKKCGQCIVHRRAGDGVIIVEHKCDRPVKRREIVEQCGQDKRDRRLSGREHRREASADRPVHRLQRGRQVAQPAAEIVFGAVERNPGGGGVLPGEPQAQQGRFTEARRRRQQHDSTIAGGIKLFQQMGPRHQPGAWPWHIEFRVQQRVAARQSRGSGSRCRLPARGCSCSDAFGKLRRGRSEAFHAQRRRRAQVHAEHTTAGFAVGIPVGATAAALRFARRKGCS